MADIVKFTPKAPAPETVPAATLQRAPQTNLAVLALVGDVVLNAIVPEAIDALNDAQLFQLIGNAQHLVSQLTHLADERILSRRAGK